MLFFCSMAFLTFISCQPVSAAAFSDIKDAPPSCIIYERFRFYYTDYRFEGEFWDRIDFVKSAIEAACKDEHIQRYLSGKTYDKIKGYLSRLEDILTSIFLFISLDPTLIDVEAGIEEESPQSIHKEGRIIKLANNFQTHPLTQKMQITSTDSSKTFFEFKHEATYLMVFLRKCSYRFKELPTDSECYPSKQTYPSLLEEDFNLLANFYDSLVFEIQAFQKEIRILQQTKKYLFIQEPMTDLEEKTNLPGSINCD